MSLTFSEEKLFDMLLNFSDAEESFLANSYNFNFNLPEVVERSFGISIGKTVF
jgi:hypothetical protein